MQTKVLSTIGTAALALSLSATVSHAGYMQPGETMGLSLISPLPEGVFAADLESYGRSKPAGSPTNVDIGVNIPVLIWSTPITFYNTRLEILAGIPFAHVDGSGLDRFGAVGAALGPLLAHDFGNGLTGGFGALVRAPDLSSNIQDLSGRTGPAIDVRESLMYKIPGNGPFGGISLMQNTAYTTTFKKQGSTTITSDGLYGSSPERPVRRRLHRREDVRKVHDRLRRLRQHRHEQRGPAGYGSQPVRQSARKEHRARRSRRLRFRSLRRDRYRDAFAVSRAPSFRRSALHEETRGWFRVVVPLYIAPPPSAPVVARY